MSAPSPANKHDGGKLRFDLIPPEAELALADILTGGAKKYGDRNWEQGFEGGPQANWDRIYGAIRRHIIWYLLGERLDQESGKPHLWHALCGMAFLVTYEARGMLPEKNDVMDYVEDMLPKLPAPEHKLPLVITNTPVGPVEVEIRGKGRTIVGRPGTTVDIGEDPEDYGVGWQSGVRGPG